MLNGKSFANATLSVSGAYETAADGLQFAKTALMLDQLNDTARRVYTQGLVQCHPQFENSAIVYKREAGSGKSASIITPITLPIRCDLRCDPDAKSAKLTYKLEFKVSVPISEFGNEKELTDPKTNRAQFFASYMQVFGPRGSSNAELAKNLRTVVKTHAKKLKGSALATAANDKDSLKAIAADCERGITSGAGTSPQFSPKQSVKFWTHTVDKEGDVQQTTYAQLTLAVPNLFVEKEQTSAEHATECAKFTDGSELHSFITRHTDIAVNAGAVRVNVARESASPSTWVDIANLINVSDPSVMTNKSVTFIGQLQAAPWQTWLNKDRMRILFKMYLNAIDIFAVEKPYMPDGSRKLVINVAAADAFDRKRKGEPAADLLEDSDDGRDTAKRQRVASEQEGKMLESTSADSLAD